MENKLKKLFDYQKFEGNPRLKIQLAKAEGLLDGYSLTDDELSFAYGGFDNTDIKDLIQVGTNLIYRKFDDTGVYHMYPGIANSMPYQENNEFYVDVQTNDETIQKMNIKDIEL